MAMQRLILPPTPFNKIKEGKVPLIYLCGPINGAPNWHDEAIEGIRFYSPEVYIASPSIRLRKEYIEGVDPIGVKGWKEQEEWENYHMVCAQEKGCILFWFPKQIPHKPKEIQNNPAQITDNLAQSIEQPAQITDKPKEVIVNSGEIINKQYKIYAESTIFNLGRYSILLQKRGIKIAVGIEPGFSGQRSIINILNMDNPDLEIFSALEETCKKASILACK